MIMEENNQKVAGATEKITNTELVKEIKKESEEIVMNNEKEVEEKTFEELEKEWKQERLAEMEESIKEQQEIESGKKDQFIIDKIEETKELLQPNLKEADTKKEIQQILKENRKSMFNPNRGEDRQKIMGINILLKARNEMIKAGIEMSKFAYIPQTLDEAPKVSLEIGQNIVKCTNELQKVIEKRIMDFANTDIITIMKEQENNETGNRLEESIAMLDNIFNDIGINTITEDKT